ncbi:MAG TPA: histidine phosphatase family protein [Solirubrobacteraceae bacterium]|nr:histidine phosphatase family protein [Solirubrobacteraceae bacterium]
MRRDHRGPAWTAQSINTSSAGHTVAWPPNEEGSSHGQAVEDRRAVRDAASAWTAHPCGARAQRRRRDRPQRCGLEPEGRAGDHRRPPQARRRDRGAHHRQVVEALDGGEEGGDHPRAQGDRTQHRREEGGGDAQHGREEGGVDAQARHERRHAQDHHAQGRDDRHAQAHDDLPREEELSERYPQRAFALPPDATEVVLVRHGASAAAIPGQPFPLVLGRGDPPLSPEGDAQAEAVAARLAAEPIAALFVTPLQRTAQTAAPLAARTGLEPVAIEDLCEIHLGEWEGGELRIRVANRDPLALRLREEERWDLIPGAEPADALAARVRAGIESVVAATGPGAVAAAFVHGGIIGEACRQATGSRPFAFIHADNASLTRLVVFGDGRWLLRSFNDTAHL